jgi:hypothetical protein
VGSGPARPVGSCGMHARTHTHTRMHAHSRTHAHTRTHARTHAHMHARTHTRARAHARARARAHGQTRTRQLNAIARLIDAAGVHTVPVGLRVDPSGPRLCPVLSSLISLTDSSPSDPKRAGAREGVFPHRGVTV